MTICGARISSVLSVVAWPAEGQSGRGASLADFGEHLEVAVPLSVRGGLLLSTLQTAPSTPHNPISFACFSLRMNSVLIKKFKEISHYMYVLSTYRVFKGCRSSTCRTTPHHAVSSPAPFAGRHLDAQVRERGARVVEAHAVPRQARAALPELGLEVLEPPVRAAAASANALHKSSYSMLFSAPCVTVNKP